MGKERWVETTLGECCQLNPRYQIDNESLEVTFVTMADISEDIPSFKNSRIRKLSEVRKGFTHFGNGDVLFAKITPCMQNGKAAIAQNLKNNIGYGTTELHVLRPMPGVLSSYLYNFIHQTKFRKEAEERFTGSAGQLRVPIDFIVNVSFPLPPLIEQKRIVGKLDTILPKVKSAKARLEKIPGILKKFRQSVLAAACSGRLTEGWRDGTDFLENGLRLSDCIMSMLNGIYKKDEFYSNDGVICLRMYNINSTGKVHFFNLKRMILSKEELIKFSLLSGDILINRVNSSELVGKSAIITDKDLKEPLVFESKNIRIRLNKKLANSYFINYHLIFEKSKGTFGISSKQTAGMATISQPQISGLPIMVPPIKEQNEIVRRVEKLFARADSLEAKYKKAQERVEKIEQAVLAKAFRGELAEPDPNDEPAEELLKRILEEKAKIKPKNRKSSGKKR